MTTTKKNAAKTKARTTKRADSVLTSGERAARAETGPFNSELAPPQYARLHEAYAARAGKRAEYDDLCDVVDRAADFGAQAASEEIESHLPEDHFTDEERALVMLEVARNIVFGAECTLRNIRREVLQPRRAVKA